MIQVYKVDEAGFLIGVELIESTEMKEDSVVDSVPQGLYMPKWVGSEWIEGKTEEKFLEDKFLASLQPSQIEVEKAEHQLKIIELLIELEVI